MAAPRRTRVVRSMMRRLESKTPAAATRLATLAPDDHEVQIRKARLINRSSGPEAAANYIASLGASWDDPELLNRRAYYLERGSNYTAAAETYARIIQLSPSETHGYMRRALCLKEIGDLKGAIECAEIAAELDPSAPEPHELVLDLSKGIPGWKRLKILEAGAQSHSDSLDWQRRLASQAFSMKQWQLAARAYEWCERHGDEGNDALFAGIALSRQGNITEARAHWLTAVQRDKRPIVTELGAGRLLQEKGYWKDAAREYRHVVETTPKPEAAVIHALGFAYARQYRWGDAISYLRRAVQLAPTEKKTWYDLAFALERKGDFAEAATAYRASLNSNSPHAYRRYRMIWCLLKAGDVDAAAKELPTYVPQKRPDGVNIAWDEQVLRDDLVQAMKRSDGPGCLAVAEAAVNARYDGLADEAFSAAEQRLEAHDPVAYLHHAACLMRLGRKREAVETYLSSKQFGKPYGVNVDDYVKTRAQKESALFVAYCDLLPVDPDVVLYESNHGSAITCSVKPLAIRMLATPRGEDMTHVVVINDRERIPEDLRGRTNVIFISKQSDAYIRYLATAGWLISNNTFPPYFSRREQQKYLNVWHGTPMKTLGKDIRSGVMDHRNATRNFLHVTHLATPNMFTGRVLLDRYDVARLFPGEFAVTGSPRMDVTLKLSGERRTAIRRRLGASPSQRIVLFAPTWRGDLADKKVDLSQIESDLAAMNAEDVVVAFRGHPLMESGLAGLTSSAVNVPNDIDTNELLGAVDVVVSDYSSIAIDSVGAGVRTILYVYDRAEYESERGLYMALEELPVEVVNTRDELAAAVSQREWSAPEDLGKFAEMWAHEDGNATDRVLGFLFDGLDVGQTKLTGERRKKEAVLFEGHFAPNGVTASARELNKFLVANGVGVTVSVEGAKIIPIDERAEIFRSLPDDVYALPLVGSALRDPEEQWLNTIFMSRDELWSTEQMNMLRRMYGREYRRLYGDAHFDVAVCFEGYTRYWLLVLGSAPSGVRKVVYLHSDMAREARRRFPYLDGVAKVYPWFDCIASVSESAMESNAMLVDDPAGRFEVAANLVDCEAIREAADVPVGAECDAFLGRHSGTIYVQVGRLSLEKNNALAIRAFCKVRGEDDAMLIVGDGPERAALGALASKLGVADHVFFAGHDSNPYRYLRRADVFVLTSLFEGQGIVVLESLVLGVPVVSVDIPGPRSILQSGGGLLVHADVDSIADGMRRIAAGERHGEFSIDDYLTDACAAHVRVLGV